jgi:hypothetical protein
VVGSRVQCGRDWLHCLNMGAGLGLHSGVRVVAQSDASAHRQHSLSAAPCAAGGNGGWLESALRRSGSHRAPGPLAASSFQTHRCSCS